MTIGGVFFVLLGIALILIDNSGPSESKHHVGDVYGFVNPGTGSDPTIPPKPFAGIYIITEIKDGIATLSYQTSTNGLQYVGHEELAKVGMFDKKLIDGEAERSGK